MRLRQMSFLIGLVLLAACEKPADQTRSAAAPPPPAPVTGPPTEGCGPLFEAEKGVLPQGSGVTGELAEIELLARRVYALSDEDVVKQAGSLLTPDLTRLWQAERALVEKEGIGNLDFDFRSNSQDPDIRSLTFATERTARGARVTASFKEWCKPSTVLFDVVKTPAGWRIEEIIPQGADGKPWPLSKFLAP